MKSRRGITFTTIAQSIFLTVQYFMRNGLFSYASSCAFDLIFSFIPILMMFVIVLVRFFHASPETVTAIFMKFPDLFDYLSTDAIIESTKTVNSITSVEIVLAVFIIWMARRFFASIFSSMKAVFHGQQKRRPIINQILSFVFEFVLVLAAASVTFVFLSLRTLFTLPFFEPFLNIIPPFIITLTENFMVYIPNILILLVVSFLYKIAAGTKPAFRLCFGAGFLCTMLFWCFRVVLHFFLDIGKYNLIYGILGSAIVLLMDIYFFFLFFLFFAQFIFVFQFFDELLTGELYLLPPRNEKNLFASVQRALFIKPDYLLAKESSVIHLKPGDFIFRKGEKSDSVYYLADGIVAVFSNDEEVNTVLRGEFFGELDAVLGKERSADTVALNEVCLVKFDEKTFLFLLEKNQDAARKMLGLMNSNI